jgi:hypothetical protein
MKAIEAELAEYADRRRREADRLVEAARASTGAPPEPEPDGGEPPTDA